MHEEILTLAETPAYKGEGPVMQIVSVGPCAKPAQEVVSF